MKSYNTSEILVLAHKEAKAIWRESKKGTWNKNWSYGKTYHQVLSVCLKKVWYNAKYSTSTSKKVEASNSPKNVPTKEQRGPGFAFISKRDYYNASKYGYDAIEM